MPGLVKSIAVKEGQEVKAGEPLCIVEAMKMENVLRAERDGTVKKILAKAGRLARGRRGDHGVRLTRRPAARLAAVALGRLKRAMRRLGRCEGGRHVGDAGAHSESLGCRRPRRGVGRHLRRARRSRRLAAVHAFRPRPGKRGRGVFHGVGVVTAVDRAKGWLTLDHEAIKGFMGAMEMMYRVEPPRLAAGLRVGDRVAFDIDAARYAVVAIRVLPRAQ